MVAQVILYSGKAHHYTMTINGTLSSATFLKPQWIIHSLTFCRIISTEFINRQFMAVASASLALIRSDQRLDFRYM